jgi:flagellin-like hook-associated protein FlgL
MRITQKNIQRAYLNNLHRNMKQLATSNERMSSGRRLNRVSDNVSDAQRALTIRDKLQRSEQYLRNIDKLQLDLNGQETSLMQMNEIIARAQSLLVNAKSDTNGPSERTILAKELDYLGESIVQLMNVQGVDRPVFAGIDGKTPIVLGDGTVSIHGLNVDALVTPEITGQYIDIGLGLQFNGANVKESSVVRSDTSPLEILGSGMDNGTPNNLIRVFQELSKGLKDNDLSNFEALSKKVSSAHDRLLVSLTDLGARNAYLDNTKNRMEIDQLQLTEMQNKLEAVDIESELIQNKSLELTWQVSLQLGSKVLPMSIFDFIR